MDGCKLVVLLVLNLLCCRINMLTIHSFFKYVFPALPVVSRSQLGISSSSPSPNISSLSTVSTGLLAAIYATSLAFSAYDADLCVLKAYQKPPTSQLWRLVYEEISREIHTPRLSVLQACLLYLQKPRTALNSAAADTPFTWSFMASTVGLANTLGLHIDCQDWRIPAWEKRLRRRLWWTVYSEEKWRSLLYGRPTLISRDQWEVSHLQDDDFLVDSSGSNDHDVISQFSPECELHFRHLTTLAEIGDDIYQSF